MLSIARMAAGQGAYYLDLASEDYYLDGGEPPGWWWGDAAHTLGLEGKVTPEPLKNLLVGRRPNGKRLVQNAAAPGRRPGFDLTFSAPKSVSVLWAAAPEPVRRAIQQVQQAAVTEALRFIQDTAAFVRRGKGGHTHVPATLAVATFEHGTSRALEPQLHTHALVMNIAVAADGRFGALDARQLFHIKMTAGAAYRAELSAQLEQRLGLKSVRKKSWFELEGVPETLIKTFSSRRAAIVLALKSVGLETASAAAMATLKTRPVKEVVPPRSELFSSWRETAKQFGFSLQEAAALCRQPPKRDTAQTLTAISAEAVDGLLSRLTSFTEREYLRAGFETAQGRGAGIAEVRAQVAQHVAQSQAFVLDPESRSAPRYSTPRALAARQHIRDMASSLKRSATRRGVSNRLIERAIRQYSSPRSALAGILRHHAAQLLRAARCRKTKPVNRLGIRYFASRSLTREQQTLLTLLTRRSAHRLRIVKGTGDRIDILTLVVAVGLWQEAGYKVLTLTHSKRLARGLRDHAGIRSATIAAFGYWLRPSLGYLTLQHGTQLLRSAMKKPTSRPKKFAAGKETVVFVHDADKLAAHELTVIVDAVKKGGGSLMLLGEPRTLHRETSLDQSQSQDMAHATAASRQLNTSSPAPANGGETPVAPMPSQKTYLQVLSDTAIVTSSPNHARSVNHLIADWARREAKTPQNAFILCDTEHESQYINQHAQAARLAAEVIDARNHISFNGLSLYRGDRVRFTNRSRPLRIEKGDVGTILRIDESRRVLEVRCDSGHEVVVPLRDYHAVSLGYATTLRDAPVPLNARAYVLCGREMTRDQFSVLRTLPGGLRLYVHGLPPTRDTSHAPQSRHTTHNPRLVSPAVSPSEGPELSR